MYRQGNGITDHYSLFLRKSRYSACKLYRSAERWLRMFFSCSFFHHFLFSFSSFFFFLFFFPFVCPSFLLLSCFSALSTPSNSVSMNRWGIGRCEDFESAETIFRNFGKINAKTVKLVNIFKRGGKTNMRYLFYYLLFFVSYFVSKYDSNHKYLGWILENL